MLALAEPGGGSKPDDDELDPRLRAAAERARWLIGELERCIRIIEGRRTHRDGYRYSVEYGVLLSGSKTLTRVRERRPDAPRLGEREGDSSNPMSHSCRSIWTPSR